MDVLNPECAAQSVGPANQLFGLLVQTILAAQCAISPKDMWPKDYGPTAVEQGLNEPFDFIVVGAGSAGSVVASRLSENPNWKVLLLEAGGDPPIESEIPFMTSSLQNTAVDWGYSIQKSPKIGSLLASNLTWPSGKFVGGSAGMDVRFYVRGNPRDFNEWENAGNPNWNWQNMLQYFKKAENHHTVPKSNDGDSAEELLAKAGPLPIVPFMNEQPFKQTLFDAAEELGYRTIADLNGNEYIGIGRAPGTISQGKLYNAAKAYLSPFRNRTNLFVIKYAHVTKVNVDNTTGQVTGVRFQINQTQELTAVATKETILSAGSIATPKILQLSGIGLEKYLTRLNISVVRNLYTGFSLQNHVTVPLFIRFNVSDVQMTETNTNNDGDANTAPKTTETKAKTSEAGADSTDTLYDYIKQRKDIAELQNIFDVLGFFSTINSPYPNIGTQYAIFKKNDEILLTEYLKVKIGLNETVAQPIIDANKNADIAIIFVTLLNSLTLGKVRLSSADSYALPLIQWNYLDRPEDIKTLVDGVQLARSFLQTTPFKKLNASDIILSIPDCETVPIKTKKVKPAKQPKEKSKKNGKRNKEQMTAKEAAPLDEPLPEAIPFGSDQYFECYVKRVSKTHYQPVGTSKMGPRNDRFAVVDSRLKVHHLTGLRVVDASIMPKIISAPIDAATIAIAEKASDLIKEDWATSEPVPQTTIADDSVDATHEEL